MIGHPNPRLRPIQGHAILGLLLGIAFPLGVQGFLGAAAAQGATQPAIAQTALIDKVGQPVPTKAERGDVAPGHAAPGHAAPDHAAPDHAAAGDVNQSDMHQSDMHQSDVDQSDDDDQGNDEVAPMADPSAVAPVALTPTTHGSQFAMGFPETWVVTHGDTDPLLTATSAGDPIITTEVSWYAQAPGAMVPTILADIQAKGYTVTLYDAIALDNTTALRLWLADLPDPGLPYAFMTVVGYSDATVVLISRYETRNPEVDNLLNQIHESFRRGEAAAATDTHQPFNDTNLSRRR